MTKYLFLLFIVGCDSYVDKAQDRCEKVIDDKINQVEDEIWQQCVESVAPPLEEAIAQLTAELEKLRRDNQLNIQLAVNSAVVDILTAQGCVSYDGDWKCHTTEDEILTSLGCVLFVYKTGERVWNCQDSTVCDSTRQRLPRTP